MLGWISWTRQSLLQAEAALPAAVICGGPNSRILEFGTRQGQEPGEFLSFFGPPAQDER
jgi:hypothetical protein